MNIHLGYAAAPSSTVSDTLYTDLHDQQKHQSAIRAIAEELGKPLEEVAERYEQVLSDLKPSARITDYLPLLVTKRVRQNYLQH